MNSRMSSPRRTAALGLLIIVLALALSACGSSASGAGSNSSSSTSTTQHCGTFTKIKIAAHFGIAYAAFKRYLYDPWRAGKFAKGTPHRASTIVKAAIAALVGLHEAKVGVSELRGCGTGVGASSVLTAIESKLTGVKNNTTSASSNAQLSSQVGSLYNDYQQLRGAA